MSGPPGKIGSKQNVSAARRAGCIRDHSAATSVMDERVRWTELTRIKLITVRDHRTTRRAVLQPRRDGQPSRSYSAWRTSSMTMR
jgi:hypothetical protein